MQGRNSGIKAVFGGSQKKPLMTKVSMRHLNEIVRERNQYSRDAMEAWQDFITLKGRMDTDLSKVTKRNNFLVEELESWKQQFLKFQAFAEQLTKETQDLKTKIESHKRENRRLTQLIDQQKDDAARLTIRLSGTEKQRDDALEALVLQQEMAEELERERKRNKKELATLQHANATLLRQRDDSQRVVLHLRSLINGQTHHMEHIVRSLNTPSELSSYIEEGFDDAPEDARDSAENSDSGVVMNRTPRKSVRPRPSSSRVSSHDGLTDANGENVTPEMESRFFNSLIAENRTGQGSRLSMVDVADRHLREKTDAIADIIRNISNQCAAAVEGLQLAQDADHTDSEEQRHFAAVAAANQHNPQNSLAPSEDGHPEHTSLHTTAGSDIGTEDGHDHSSSLHPDDVGRASRSSSIIPPTPDLVNHRSSTSMSGYSASTAPDRNSGTYSTGAKIVEGEGSEYGDAGSEVGAGDSGVVGGVHGVTGKERERPVTAMMVEA